VLIEKTWYLEAKSLLEGDNPDPVSAIACLEEIPDYEGAAELARQAHYAYGKQLQAAGETATAAEQFYLAKGYEDADEQANVSYYAPAVKALEAGKFKEAARLAAEHPRLQRRGRPVEASHLSAGAGGNESAGFRCGDGAAESDAGRLQ